MYLWISMFITLFLLILILATNAEFKTAFNRTETRGQNGIIESLIAETTGKYHIKAAGAQRENGKNIALNKKVYTTSLHDKKDDTTVLTDGENGTCDRTKSIAGYLIVDLKATYKIDHIGFIGDDDKIFQQFEIVAINNFKWCNIANATNWRVCKGTRLNNIFSVSDDQCAGRYVGYRFKKYPTLDRTWTKICEVIIQGSKVSNSEDSSSPSTGCELLPASKNILRNIKWKSSYNTRLTDQKLDSFNAYNKCYRDQIGKPLKINLNDPYKISFIRFWNSRDTDEYGTFYTVDVLVGSTLLNGRIKYQTVGKNLPMIGPAINIHLIQPMIGDTIMINSTLLKATTDYLLVCEVEVTGKKEKKPENLALNKKVYTTGLKVNKNDTTVFTDGKINTCDLTKSLAGYLIVDLQAIYDIASIQFNGKDDEIFQQFDIVAINNFNWCNIENAANWRVCKGTRLNNIFSVSDDQCTGRYVGYRFKKYPAFDRNWIKICEIIIYGTKPSNSEGSSDPTTGCELLPASKNIMRNIKWESSYNTRLTDQKLDSFNAYDKCYRDQIGKPLKINLNDRYKISFIRLWNGRQFSEYGTYYTVDVFVGYKLLNGRMNYTTVGKKLPIIGPTINIHLTQPLVADTIMINSTLLKATTDYFLICEVEVTGKKQALPKNVALNKKVYTTPLYYKLEDTTALTDGKKDTCDETKNVAGYLIVDLGARYNIAAIEFIGSAKKIFRFFDIVAIDEFIWCNVQNASRWTKCQGSTYEGTFSPSDGNCVGRYVGYRFNKNPTLDADWVKICEVIVYGNKVSGNLITKTNENNQLNPSNNCKLFSKDKNALSFNRDNSQVADQIIDSTKQCSWIETGNLIKFRFTDRYIINFIRIWNKRYRDEGTKITIDVFLGYKQASGILQYKEVGKDVPVIGHTTNIHLDEPIKADVISLKGNLIQTDKKDSLYMCEVEVLGTLIELPPLKSEPLPLISQNDFPLSQRLRQGSKQVNIREWSCPISYKEDCEPIVNFPSKPTKSYIMACRYGKGRVILMGRKSDAISFKPTMDQAMRENVYSWLTNNVSKDGKSGGTTVYAQEDWQKAAASDIVWINLQKDTPNISELSKKLFNPGFGLVIEGSKQYDPFINHSDLLDKLGVEFVEDGRIYDGQTTLTASDYANFSLPLNRLLERMLKSHSEFMRSSPKIGDMRIAEVRKSTTQKMKKLMNKYMEHAERYCPTIKVPLYTKKKKELLSSITNILRSQLLIGTGIKAPCIDSFPGDVSPLTPRISAIVTVYPISKNELLSTGMYLAAGDIMEYEVIPDGTDSKIKWDFKIGCFTKDTNRIVNEEREFLRYPIEVTYSAPFGGSTNRKKGQVYSAFGGVVWLQTLMEPKIGTKLTIRISNVVRTRFLNLRQSKSIVTETWRDIVKNPTKYAPVIEIQGNYFGICVSVRHATNFPYSDMKTIWKKYWDPAVLSYISTRLLLPEKHAMERFSIDEQLPVGSGLSGYPIAAYPSWVPTLTDLDEIEEKGSWGVCHEIGHNMVYSPINFEGSKEIVNNIFCLIGLKMFWNMDAYSTKLRILNPDYLKNTAKLMQKFNDTTVKYEVWKSDVTYGLCMFAQIIKTFGIGIHQKLHAYVYKHPPEGTDRALRDIWYEGYSNVTGFNLLPIFEFWNFPISPEAINKYKDLPCLLPDDKLTQNAPLRRAAFAKKFHNKCVDQSAAKKFDLNYPADKVNRPNNMKVTIVT